MHRTGVVPESYGFGWDGCSERNWFGSSCGVHQYSGECGWSIWCFGYFHSFEGIICGCGGSYRTGGIHQSDSQCEACDFYRYSNDNSWGGYARVWGSSGKDGELDMGGDWTRSYHNGWFYGCCNGCDESTSKRNDVESDWNGGGRCSITHYWRSSSKYGRNVLG